MFILTKVYHNGVVKNEKAIDGDFEKAFDNRNELKPWEYGKLVELYLHNEGKLIGGWKLGEDKILWVDAN